MSRMEVHQAHSQSQSLSPRLQHAVRLLQMSSMEFAATLRDTLGRNPFLEADELDEASSAQAPHIACGDDGHGDEAHFGTAGAGSPVTDIGDAEVGFDGSDRELWLQQPGGRGGARGLGHADDAEVSALDMTAAHTSLASHLHAQLCVMHLAPRDMLLARVVAESLDDDGYLRAQLADLLDASEMDPAPSLQEWQMALRTVQSLDPAGVGARDVGECLLLQLPAVACARTRELAQRIVSTHLHALAARDILGLSRQLDRPAAEVEAVCERIRRLDPRPGWRYGSSHIAYVVPDVLVRRQRGQWAVRLNPAVVPKVRLNQVYADLFQRHRTRQNTEMAGHLNEARWTVRNVEQRFSTILDVAESIVRRQRHFLEFGPMAMKPLGLREIADEVGIHESTVSRVTNNKYMATPSGVFELKHFFSRAMVSDSGRACSGTAIRSLVRDIIEAETAHAPLSDAQITRQLQVQGLKLARRTVTKYRQMLKIEPVERRRRHQ